MAFSISFVEPAIDHMQLGAAESAEFEIWSPAQRRTEMSAIKTNATPPSVFPADSEHKQKSGRKGKSSALVSFGCAQL